VLYLPFVDFGQNRGECLQIAVNVADNGKHAVEEDGMGEGEGRQMGRRPGLRTED
jgi:hypothetical protein